MSVWSEFETEAEKIKSQKGCALGRLLDSLDAKDREILERVLASEVSHAWVVSAFKEKNLSDIRSAETIRKHRVGLCSCKEVS